MKLDIILNLEILTNFNGLK